MMLIIPHYYRCIGKCHKALEVRKKYIEAGNDGMCIWSVEEIRD